MSRSIDDKFADFWSIYAEARSGADAAGIDEASSDRRAWVAFAVTERGAAAIDARIDRLTVERKSLRKLAKLVRKHGLSVLGDNPAGGSTPSMPAGNDDRWASLTSPPAAGASDSPAPAGPPAMDLPVEAKPARKRAVKPAHGATTATKPGTAKPATAKPGTAKAVAARPARQASTPATAGRPAPRRTVTTGT